ncbi:hypothetical protein XELAEV_18030841mg [Xenopus laevis]|uniref:Uncharacterized protein n=1 Tax=Xenopus laevis TaxID=8355 RepID=A0A974CMQ2_XENLA|nr:hypothetical protein XELAEV_18030841mg [Xenopus laevis]
MTVFTSNIYNKIHVKQYKQVQFNIKNVERICIVLFLFVYCLVPIESLSRNNMLGCRRVFNTVSASAGSCANGDI